MANFVSCVRFTAKPGMADEVKNRIEDFGLPAGALQHFGFNTGGDSFCTVVMWASEQDLANARPQMIAFLDTVRDKLIELSPELGVTDPVSGPVFVNVSA